MKISLKILIFFPLLILSTLAFGETLAGTVKNGTTGKPAAGDDVVLINLSQGMDEAGRTKTDAQGKFSFKMQDTAGPHLVRVIHQGVTYHRMAPPGTTSVEAEVFDVSAKVEGLNVVADLMYVQTGQGQLGISRLFEVDNNSKPPRTQMNDQNLEFYLPEGAQVDQSQAQTAGGQWVESAAVPQKEKGRYAFIFPLRPGATQFQVSYHLAYSGSAKIDPKPIYAMEHFVIVLPQSIQFSAAQAGLFKEQKPPEPGATAEVAVNIHPGQLLAFSISGEGMLQSQNSAGGGEGGSGGTASAPEAADSRPGGGLGPPIDAPDPLEKYRWPILGGFAFVLAAGAIYLAKRPQARQIPDFAPAEVRSQEIPPSVTPAPAPRPGLLLEALKEELFELEMEHKLGKITQPEYEKAKAALDQTLERALKRAK